MQDVLWQRDYHCLDVIRRIVDGHILQRRLAVLLPDLQGVFHKPLAKP
jgi:hypothetical protein